MKYLLTLFILALLTIAGCTEEQNRALRSLSYDLEDSQRHRDYMAQREADRINQTYMQGRTQPNNYWQEQRARQEYYDYYNPLK